MTTFNYMYNHLPTSSIEDYFLNASVLLGNQGQQDQPPAAHASSCGDMTASSNNSSSNSCIDDFDFMNPLLSTGMFTPASTIVYDDGMSCSSSYPMPSNEAMSYFFLPTPALTVCSGLYDEPSVKMEYDEFNCFSPPQQQLLQPQDMPFYEEDYLQPQQFPNSPESMYSTDSLYITTKQEAFVTADQIQQTEAQTQAETAKELAALTTTTSSSSSPSSSSSLSPSLSSSSTTTTTSRPKLFACTHCNRTFARKYDAARHKRIHTGVKPYFCPCCNKGFARSDARVRHFRTEYNCRDGADKIQQNRQRNHN